MNSPVRRSMLSSLTRSSYTMFLMSLRIVMVKQAYERWKTKSNASTAVKPADLQTRISASLELPKKIPSRKNFYLFWKMVDNTKWWSKLKMFPLNIRSRASDLGHSWKVHFEATRSIRCRYFLTGSVTCGSTLGCWGSRARSSSRRGVWAALSYHVTTLW